MVLNSIVIYIINICIVHAIQIGWRWLDFSRSSKVKGCRKCHSSQYGDNGLTLPSSSKVKGHSGKWKSIYEFLQMSKVTVCLKWTIKPPDAIYKYGNLCLTFQGHQRSEVMVENERPHMTSYEWSIVMVCLKWTIKPPDAIYQYGDLGLTLQRSPKVRGHS